VAAAAVSTGFHSRVVGQREARARLSEAVRSRRVAHAYLFSGPRGVGKTALAIEFAALLLCEREGTEPCGECIQCPASLGIRHPDLHLAFPLPSKKGGTAEEDERDFADVVAAQVAALAADPYAPLRLPRKKDGRSKTAEKDAWTKTQDIRISLVRGLIHHASMKPYQARRKLLIILHADGMNTQAQNALLKALEEPPSDAYFLLTTENEGGLLQTIRSRCQRLRLAPLSSEEIAGALVNAGVAAPQAELAAAMSGGSLSHARELSRDNLEDLQQRVIAFLRAAAVCDPLDLPKVTAALLDNERLTEQTALEFIGLLLRDVALSRAAESVARRPVTFRGFEDRIEAILLAYPEADFDAAARAVDVAADYLARGYTRDFVMYALAIRLHEALGPRAKSPVKQTRAEHA
jgi:DNA polymerase-3 subunit delta'